MPIGSGLMTSGRINVFQTTIDYTISPDDGAAAAGDSITFNISAVSRSGTATGNVHILNMLNGNILVNGTLDGYGHVSLTANLPGGQHNFIAVYDGAHNNFKASVSESKKYAVNNATASTIISKPTADDENNYFSSAQDYPVEAYVTASYLNPIGSVVFTVWSDNTKYTTIYKSAIVGIDGYARIMMPANSLIGDGYTHYLQAQFYGGAGYSNNATDPGTSGLVITPVSNDHTTCVISIPIFEFDAVWCIHSNNAVVVTVTPDKLPLPSIGYVNLVATMNINSGDESPNIVTVDLGNIVPIDGEADFIVPANTFPVAHIINLYATYVGDGQSYAGSTDTESFTPTNC